MEKTQRERWLFPGAGIGRKGACMALLSQKPAELAPNRDRRDAPPRRAFPFVLVNHLAGAVTGEAESNVRVLAIELSPWLLTLILENYLVKKLNLLSYTHRTNGEL